MERPVATEAAPPPPGTPPPPPAAEGEGGGGFAAVRTAVDRARGSILLYGAALLACSGASWPLAQRSFEALAKLAGRPLVSYSPAEPFLALISISASIGLALSFPLLAHLLFRILSSRFPGTFPRRGVLVVPAATVLFLAGGALAWFLLLPAGVSFLVAFETPETKALLSIRSFVSFCTTFVVALGAAFQAPLAALLLARAGILTPALFRKSWRMAILGCTVLSAVLTPTPDAYNMGLMILPLLSLFGASWVVTILFGRKRGAEAGGGPPAEPAG